MDTVEIKDLLLNIICGYCWEDINKKAKAIFTTICLMEEIEDDKTTQHKYLIYLYNEGVIEETDTSFAEFENYMTQDL